MICYIYLYIKIILDIYYDHIKQYEVNDIEQVLSPFLGLLTSPKSKILLPSTISSHVLFKESFLSLL